MSGGVDLVREWFHRLAELPPEQQAHALTEARLDDSLRAELRELLALDRRAVGDALLGDRRLERGGLVLRPAWRCCDG